MKNQGLLTRVLTGQETKSWSNKNGPLTIGNQSIRSLWYQIIPPHFLKPAGNAISVYYSSKYTSVLECKLNDSQYTHIIYNLLLFVLSILWCHLVLQIPKREEWVLGVLYSVHIFHFSFCTLYFMFLQLYGNDKNQAMWNCEVNVSASLTRQAPMGGYL